MMTLQQTIDHHKRISDSYQHTAPECDTAMEHLQLANWLEELINARRTLGLPDFPRDTAATEMIRLSDLLNRESAKTAKLESALKEIAYGDQCGTNECEYYGCKAEKIAKKALGEVIK